MTCLTGCLVLFLYCYYGAVATESFEGMADALYETNWQDLPIALQKYILIMMINSQQPLYYHGFGVAILNLELYTRVSTFFRPFKKQSVKFYFIFIISIDIFSSCVESIHITRCSRPSLYRIQTEKWHWLPEA